MAAGKHLILATIINVLPGQVTYPACVSCYTKLHHLNASDRYQCQRCGKLYELGEVSHRYRLAVKVTNQSVCRDVTVFGSCLEPYFGTDATKFARYMEHASLCHQTSNSELHTFVTNALVGHPFYFGFKMSGNCFPQRSHLSSVPLANIAARDNESLVAVQMTSPFQSWNFPTVMQGVFNLISTQSGQCNSGDKCDVCPLKDFLQHQYREGNDEDDLETTEQLGDGGVHKRAIFDRTCSKQDTTHNESSRASSILGETFFTGSIPSFRLSCDKILSTTKQTPYCSRLSDGSMYTGRSSINSTEINGLVELAHEPSNLPQSSNNDSTALHEIGVCESTEVFETIHRTAIAANCHLENTMQSKGQGESCYQPLCTEDYSECKSETVHRTAKAAVVLQKSCRKTVPNLDHHRNAKCGDSDCVMKDYKGALVQDERPPYRETGDICHRTINESNGISPGIKEHNQNSAAMNDSSVIQEYEDYMNKWLEENSFDGWSYHESILNHVTNPIDSETKKEVEAFKNKDEVKASPSDVSHASSCPDFPDDLPFTEDIDQFLLDVEEAYAFSREKAVIHTSHSTEDSLMKINNVSGSDKNLKSDKFRSVVANNRAEGVVCAGQSAMEVTEREMKSIKTHHSELQCSDNLNFKDRCPPKRSSCEVADSEMRTDSVYDDYYSSRNQSPEHHKNSCRNVIVKEVENSNGSNRNGSCSMDYENEGEYSFCNKNPEQHVNVKCKTLMVQEEQKEPLGMEQLMKNNHNDGNTRRRERRDKDFCGGFALMENSVQNEHSLNSSSMRETEADSVWCEDFSQSPLLFSQSQSPILPSGSPRCLTFRHPRSLQEQSCLDSTNNSPLNQDKACPKLRFNSDQSRGELERATAMPKDYSESVVDVGNTSRGLLQISDHGTPCLFSQVSDDLWKHSHHSIVPQTRNTRPFHSRTKATPLRQLFLQRARSWKMSSTPMMSKKNPTAGRSFDSPLSCGTPDLFSTENSPSGEMFFGSNQQTHSRTSSSFEYTPDLF